MRRPPNGGLVEATGLGIQVRIRIWLVGGPESRTELDL